MFYSILTSRYEVVASAKAQLLAYMKEHIEADDFFAKWSKEFSSELSQGGFDKSQWRAKLDETFAKFVKSFNKATEKDGGLVLWRCLAVPDVDKFLDGIEEKNVGVYWSYVEEGAICYEGKSDKTVTLKCVAPFSAISLERTLLVSTSWLNWDELEITLNKDAPIHVIDATWADKHSKINKKAKA